MEVLRVEARRQRGQCCSEGSQLIRGHRRHKWSEMLAGVTQRIPVLGQKGQRGGRHAARGICGDRSELGAEEDSPVLLRDSRLAERRAEGQCGVTLVRARPGRPVGAGRQGGKRCVCSQTHRVGLCQPRDPHKNKKAKGKEVEAPRVDIDDLTHIPASSLSSAGRPHSEPR